MAPTQDILDAYKKKGGAWQDYEEQFLNLMKERKIEEQIDQGLFSLPTALLCSETTAQHCHRRLVLEYLQLKWGSFTISHL